MQRFLLVGGVVLLLAVVGLGPSQAAPRGAGYFPALSDPVNVYVDSAHWYAGIVTAVERPATAGAAPRLKLTAFPPDAPPLTNLGWLDACAVVDPPCYYPWARPLP